MKKYKPIVILLLACIGGQLSAQYPRWDCRSLPDSMEVDPYDVDINRPVRIELKTIGGYYSICKQPPFDAPNKPAIVYNTCVEKYQWLYLYPKNWQEKPQISYSRKSTIEDFALYKRKLYLVLKYCVESPSDKGPDCNRDAYVLILIRNYRGKTTYKNMSRKVKLLQYAETPLEIPKQRTKALLNTAMLMDSFQTKGAYKHLTQCSMKRFELTDKPIGYGDFIIRFTADRSDFPLRGGTIPQTKYNAILFSSRTRRLIFFRDSTPFRL